MAVPIDDRVRIKTRSIMGTEIPLVEHEEMPLNLTYAFIVPGNLLMKHVIILKR